MQATTFLLDLDDTLLGNPMDRFLPPYFAALSEALAPYAGGKNVQHIVINAVHAAIDHQDGSMSNMDAFMNRFCQELACSPATLQPVFDKFYEQTYPTLRQYTVYRPDARKLVEFLLKAGCQVVVATNPLFPATAIYQRLAWAGLSDCPFSLITTMENSHFAKPALEYYREILVKVGASADQSWMVGDDYHNDIAPAQKLGMQTWWITNSPAPVNAPDRHGQGSLADFLTMLKQQIRPV